MKYIFFGSPNFANIILNQLIEAGFYPEAVVTNPDRPVGRQKVITPSLVKQTALANNIKIFQPDNPNDIITNLQDLKPDLIIISAYSQIISADILNIPTLGTVGVHPSLLPKYRGASPIQTAILSSAKESGVSLYYVDEKMDHGAILSQKTANIEGLDYSQAEDKLANLGASMLTDLLPDLSTNTPSTPQDHSQATFTSKIKTEDALIDISDLKKALAGNSKLSKTIYQKILALNSEPGSYTINSNNQRIKLLTSILDDRGILQLKTIQLAGKKLTSQFSPSLFT